ncbi:MULTISPECIES: esterase-like activity of phytase family protein [unclassified Roseitalea]|uniref:esterase-like activity of phytase family protein n=1 Tax=unclassified Roseitalea TaxID=2639107 RepID=UPI00273D2BBB|nr:MULTISPECIES: esterase-like activity of phytase family protein [unclassified Roseitalea]
MRRAAAGLAVALATAIALPPPLLPHKAHAAGVERHAMDVRVRPITRFRIGSDQMRFGALEFAGGLEMNATSRHFGALSGLSITGGQSGFIGVADTGFWITGAIRRGTDNRPTGLADVVMWAMTGRNGTPLAGKQDADAEAVATRGDVALVAFEQNHRIMRYRLAPGNPPQWQGTSPPPVPLHELRRNQGFEGLAFAPEDSPLAGALVGLSEKSLDRAGDIMGFVVAGTGASFEFSLRRRGDFDVTDIAFLPGGDMIVLERRFNARAGLGMRLRRVDAAVVTERATVDGAVLLEADMRHQIDNMEALDVSIDPDGVARLTIVSDDNHSLLQRNLLIEFRLPDRDRQAAVVGE